MNLVTGNSQPDLFHSKGKPKKIKMQRFPVEPAQVPAAPSDEDSWSISSSTSAAFRALADSACVILTKCKEKCRAQKLQGSCDALCELLVYMRERGQATKFITWDEVNQHCSLLLAREEHPPGAVELPSAAAPAAEVAAAAPRGDRGWEDVDSMFTDPEFKSGCYLFTRFFKERTREIRLAYVCGFRNALLEALDWVSKMHQMDPARVSCDATVAVCAAQVRKIAEVASRSKLTYGRLGAGSRDEMLAALSSIPLAAPFPSPAPALAPPEAHAQSHHPSPFAHPHPHPHSHMGSHLASHLALADFGMASAGENASPSRKRYSDAGESYCKRVRDASIYPPE